jgi:hypothetical protein
LVFLLPGETCGEDENRAPAGLSITPTGGDYNEAVRTLVLLSFAVLFTPAFLMADATAPPATAPAASSTDRAYLRRMIDLGTPEAAEAQAHEALRHDASDPLALGVVASVALKNGQLGPAARAAEIALASNPSPDDGRFLLGVAGRVVATYDRLTDRTALTADDLKAIESLRVRGRGQPAFADTYRVIASAPAPSKPDARAPAAAVTPPPPAPTVTYESHYYSDDPNEGYWGGWFWVPNDFDRGRGPHRPRPGRDRGGRFDTLLPQDPPPMPPPMPRASPPRPPGRPAGILPSDRGESLRRD